VGWVLWQGLGHQSGHCFNDHRLFSSLASPSPPHLFTHSQAPHDTSTTLPSHCGWTLIYWDFGISETQLPKTSCPRNCNGCHLFYSKSFLVWSFDASAGNLMLLLASGDETVNDYCRGQTVGERRGWTALSSPSGQTAFVVSVISYVQVTVMAKHSSGLSMSGHRIIVLIVRWAQLHRLCLTSDG
jgi:hypothetical protein